MTTAYRFVEVVVLVVVVVFAPVVVVAAAVVVLTAVVLAAVVLAAVVLAAVVPVAVPLLLAVLLLSVADVVFVLETVADLSPIEVPAETVVELEVTLTTEVEVPAAELAPGAAAVTGGCDGTAPIVSFRLVNFIQLFK
jgi:hypothetical protein